MNRALVVEDLQSASAWLSAVLADAFPGIEVRSAPSLKKAREALQGFRPDIALVDLGLPDGSGVELIEQINRTLPSCACIVTTIFHDDVHLFPALRAGAQGYLLKDQPKERVLQALQGIVAGEPPLSPVVARRVLKVFAASTANDDRRLSPRERETLTLIAKGLKLPDVAGQLGVTRNTAAGFIKSVYRKLNVSSRAEATLEAARMGLVKTQI